MIGASEASMGTLDRITFDPQVMGGQACVRGMRIPVSLIVNGIRTPTLNPSSVTSLRPRAPRGTRGPSRGPSPRTPRGNGETAPPPRYARAK